MFTKIKTLKSIDFKSFFIKLSTYRVKIGILFALIYILSANPTSSSFLLGLPFVILGESIRIWAAGHIIKNHTLTVSGPYSYSRHPLYLGSFIIIIGLIIIANSLTVAFLMLLYFFLFYTPTIIKEENNLKEKFKDSFRIYEKIVSPIIGKGTKWYLPGKYSPFKFSRFIYNREYEFIIVIFLIIIILLLKLKYII